MIRFSRYIAVIVLILSCSAITYYTLLGPFAPSVNSNPVRSGSSTMSLQNLMNGTIRVNRKPPSIYISKDIDGWEGVLLTTKTACVITQRREDLSRANAVFVHANVISDKDLDALIKSRSTNQTLVFLTNESPHYFSSSRIAKFNNVFNRTMHYKSDAHYREAYGMVVKGASSPVNVTLKSKSVLWMVSNCESGNQREKLAAKLVDAGLTVDQFGKCNNKRNEDTFENIIKPYRFYLAFENSNCKDYVTEKMWDPLRLGVVPIVYGGANYSDILGNMSQYKMLINTRDFKTAKDLVNYVEYLERNQTAYAEYFTWRQHAMIADRYHTAQLAMTKLCDDLWSNNIHRAYRDMVEVFKTNGQCNADDLPQMMQN